MKKHAILATILFVSLTLCLLSAYVKAQDGATIWTDKADYSPEETVTIFGTGFLPESHVTVEVTRPDLTVDSWDVTSDLDGSFTTTYLLDGILGTYTVTATDGTNTATTTFEDGPLVYSPTRYPAAGEAEVVQGGSVSFVLSITADTADTYSSGVYADISGYTAIPTAWFSFSPTTLTFTSVPATKTTTVTITVPLAAATGVYARTTKFNPRAGIGVNIYIKVKAADTTPPETSITVGPTGWINVQSATFGWTGLDDITATANLVYSWRLDGGTWTAYSSVTSTTLNGLNEGSHTFEVRAKDEAGNVDPTPATRSFSVDITAPVVTITAPVDGAWYKSAGVPAAAYTITDNLDPSPAVVQSGYSTAEGVHTYTVTASDAAGNVGSDSVTYTVDNTPPVTTKTPTGTAGSNGWYVSDVNVALSATDNGGSGVKEIHYKLDGVETTVSGSSGSFTISTDGSHSLEHWAVDNAGNEETHSTQTIKIDMTPPTVTLTPDRSADHNGWYNHAISWTVGASDATSGVASKDADFIYNGPDSSAASVSASATDEAGNTGSVTVNFKYDATPPSISGAATTSPNANGWYKTDVTVHFTAVDGLSGIDTVTPDTTLTSEGQNQHVLGTALDKAGNSATYDVTGINIDKTPPTIVGSRSPAANSYGWNREDVTVHFEASDSLSGLASVTSDIVLSAEGADQSASGTAVDKAGNEACTTVSGINIDKTPPGTYKQVSGAPGNDDWYRSDVCVTLTATDPDTLSGVKEIHYKLNGIETTVAGGTTSLTISTEGENTLEHWAIDYAGNEEMHVIQTIKIDKTPPVVTITLPPTGTYLLNQPGLFASWSATDPIPGSGVVPPNSGTLPIDTSSVGPHSLTVAAGTVYDVAGNPSAVATATYYVHYAFGGVRPPINPDGTSIFKLGSTVPVKFQLTDANGNYIATAVARLYLLKISNGVTGTELEAVSTSAATTGNLFRYDPTENQYIFNLATKPLSQGTWQLRIELDDGTDYCVNISLRK